MILLLLLSMPYDAAISYSRADVAYARKLERHLESQGLMTFRDAEIEPGERWRDVLTERFGEAKIVFVLIGPNLTRWQKREVRIAEHGGVRIVPVALPTRGTDAGPLPRRLTRLQVITFKNAMGREWK